MAKVLKDGTIIGVPGSDEITVKSVGDRLETQDAVGAIIGRVKKDNIGAIGSPAVGNDNTEGYEVGSRWLDETANDEFVCLDASTGAAIWTSTTAQATDKPLSIPLLLDEDRVNGVTFVEAGTATLDFAALSLVPANFVLRWEQTEVPSVNNAEVRVQDLTGAATLGSLLAISTLGIKSFAFTALPAAVARISLQHREDIAGAGRSGIAGAVLEIDP